MADETLEQPTAETPEPVDQTDDDFDWAKFFAEENPDLEIATPPTAETPAGVQEIIVDDDMKQLREQLAKAQADSNRALEMATQAQVQGKMNAAIDAWKQQATPAEIEFQALLLDSKTPEELQKNAQIVKTAAASVNATATERENRLRREMEQEMQTKFGLPVPPTFQPMPEKEKVKQLLEAGSLEDAAATMMKGF